jgi:hypothetical protein
MSASSQATSAFSSQTYQIRELRQKAAFRKEPALVIENVFKQEEARL